MLSNFPTSRKPGKSLSRAALQLATLQLAYMALGAMAMMMGESD